MRILIATMLLIWMTGASAPLWGQPESIEKKSRPLSSSNAQKFADLLERDWKDKPEWADMLGDLLQGKPMQANTGWFKASQKRIGLQWLAEKFDANGDAKITGKEAARFSKVFEALDKNGDGGITEVDFDWADVSHVGPSKPSEAMFYRLDRDSNGRVDQKEFMQMMAMLDATNKGFVTPDEFSKGFRPFDEPQPERTAPTQQEDPNRYLNLLFSGELGNLTDGPVLNQIAPNFDLPFLKAQGSQKLSNLRDQKIVVLNFGSFT
ncbi:MAG: EF-hand domain-containing protein [Pirellulaceae bacterium]|nr:EF-hand domain-containing protein [Pirellulaceae bacterium]